MRTALLALALTGCVGGTPGGKRIVSAQDAEAGPPSVAGSTPRDQGGVGGIGGFGGFGGELDAGELDGQVLDAGGAAGADASELDGQLVDAGGAAGADAGELDSQVLDAIVSDSQVPGDAGGPGSDRLVSAWGFDPPPCVEPTDCTPDETCFLGDGFLGQAYCYLPCGPNSECPSGHACCHRREVTLRWLPFDMCMPSTDGLPSARLSPNWCDNPYQAP